MEQLTTSTNYKDLYDKEHERVLELEKELAISLGQSKTYARELSRVFMHTRDKRKQLAMNREQLMKYADDLHRTLFNLKHAYYDTINRLVLASEYKDKDTGNHIARISRYSAHIAKKLGFTKNEVEHISFAAPMHDVGKIGIPDCIMLKNGMLTEGEFSIIKTHTVIGAGILRNSNEKIIQLARDIALCHHEKWDGSGYPDGVSGEKIPVAARIVAISDTFDALTSKRPYKSPYPVTVSCDILKKQRGRHFDPTVIDAFIDSIEDINTIRLEIDKPDPSETAEQFQLSERDLQST